MLSPNLNVLSRTDSFRSDSCVHFSSLPSFLGRQSKRRVANGSFRRNCARSCLYSHSVAGILANKCATGEGAIDKEPRIVKLKADALKNGKIQTDDVSETFMIQFIEVLFIISQYFSSLGNGQEKTLFICLT